MWSVFAEDSNLKISESQKCEEFKMDLHCYLYFFTLRVTMVKANTTIITVATTTPILSSIICLKFITCYQTRLE